MAFFTPCNFVTLCQFYSITSPVIFTKLHQENTEWEKRRFFGYMAASAYHVISKEVENQILRHNWFLDTHVCMNNPHWKSSRIIILLYKYYVVISDTLVGSFLAVLFLLLAVILSELYEKPRRYKDWVTEKSTLMNLYEEHHFFHCTSSFPCLFLLLSSSTPFPFLSDVLADWPL